MADSQGMIYTFKRETRELEEVYDVFCFSPLLHDFVKTHDIEKQLLELVESGNADEALSMLMAKGISEMSIMEQLRVYIGIPAERYEIFLHTLMENSDAPGVATGEELLN